MEEGAYRRQNTGCGGVVFSFQSCSAFLRKQPHAVSRSVHPHYSPCEKYEASAKFG